eukprot:COSAG04_NODE_961_length_9156_cov_2.510488_1_plen_43_part_10
MLNHLKGVSEAFMMPWDSPVRQGTQAEPLTSVLRPLWMKWAVP